MAVLLLMATAPICSSLGAGAEAETITSIEPADVKQGDTVLLTMKGHDLPSGAVVVEFYPQQIVVLRVLSSTSEEISVQAKVSAMASPGAYNVVVYNQLGEEAVGSGLLRIGGSSVTPVFSSYEPHRLSSQLEAQAIVMTGEMLTAEAVGLLQMDWGNSQAGHPACSFSYVNSTTAVCTLSGKVMPGTMRGKVKLGSLPIYQIDLVVEGEGPTIVGHSPTSFPASAATVTFRIVGTAIAGFEQQIAVSLVSTELTVPASKVSSIDVSTLEAQFAGPLPLGECQLKVVLGLEELYSGFVEIVTEQAVQSGQAAENAPEGGEVAGRKAPTEELASDQDVPARTAAEGVASQAQNEQTLEAMDNLPSGVPNVAPGVAQTIDIAALSSTVGPLAVTMSRGSQSVGNLVAAQVTLSVAGEYMETMLSTVRGENLLVLFAPPASGWKIGADAILVVRQDGAPTIVEAFDIQEQAQSLHAGGNVVDGDNATVPSNRVEGMGAEFLIVDLEVVSEGLKIGVDVDNESAEFNWEAAIVSSDCLILNANLSKFRVSRIASAGESVTLLLSRDAKSLPDEAWSVLSEMLSNYGTFSLTIELPELGVRGSGTVEWHSVDTSPKG